MNTGLPDITILPPNLPPNLPCHCIPGSGLYAMNSIIPHFLSTFPRSNCIGRQEAKLGVGGSK